MSTSLLKRLCNTLLALLAILGALWVGFSLAYYAVEDYRLIESFHWGMQTITTVGYGDVPPQTDWGRVLSMILSPSAVTTTLLLGANFVKHAIEDPNAFTHEEQEELRALARDTNRRVRHLERQ